MIMKLKSKDEITVKLVEKLEQYRHICDNNDDENYTKEMGFLYGEINMLKWVLNIPIDHTKGDKDA